MYLRKEDVHYADYRSLWADGYRSGFFFARRDDGEDNRNLTLSERLLFTQSNGRALLGQDPRGRLHFLCAPHRRDYAIPSGGPRVGGQFDGHIGQFYQTDLSMLLGKLSYAIELAGNYLYETADDALTYYLDHVVPVTESRYPHLEARVFSVAPIPEASSRPVSSIHPLPGPSGAIYGLHLRNTGPAPLRGRVRLRLEQRFVIQNEKFATGVYEDLAKPPMRAEWDGKLLKLYHPEASAVVQLLGAETRGMPENPEMYVPFELMPGQERDFSACVAVGESMRDTDAALGTLYRHTTLEWLNTTLGFWRGRLGRMSLGVDGDAELGDRYRDMHVRFVLDDFNCLSFDETGRMLVNWQGAPSHGLARLWGIDIEPTVISVLYAVPEVGPSAVEYMLAHNTPRFSIYPDHSTPILVAPLIIAGKYLELTGDAAFFARPEIRAGLERNVQALLACKHTDKALFSSRYASDLITFNRYDYMTNVKAWVALRAWAAIRTALGEDAGDTEALMAALLKDMRETMEADGPFGRQIKGGTNLGECAEERFYNRDDVFYYCGEDSFTCMAPLYGLYDFDYAPWRNLHTWARSLFLPNYDPEYRSMRELHYGMNPSGTGNTLRLGGSVTRREMKEALSILFDRLDCTGSLFWWPRGDNKRRVLTRCSQGQGSWIQQSAEQWLGLRYDALRGELQFRPQGLLDSIRLQGYRVGNLTVDLDWEETPEGTELRLVNRNTASLSFVYGQRRRGAGAEGGLLEHRRELSAGETMSARFEPWGDAEPEENCRVGRAELERLGSDGLVFGAYGMILPNLYFGPCDVFQLRFVAVSDGDMEDASMAVEVPEGWQIAPKANFHWDDEPDFRGRRASVNVPRTPAFRHGVAVFNVLLPREWMGENQVLLWRDSVRPEGGDAPERLLIRADVDAERDVGEIRASLRVGGKTRSLCLPVRLLGAEAFNACFDRMIRG